MQKAGAGIRIENLTNKLKSQLISVGVEVDKLPNLPSLENETSYKKLQREIQVMLNKPTSELTSEQKEFKKAIIANNNTIGWTKFKIPPLSAIEESLESAKESNKKLIDEAKLKHQISKDISELPKGKPAESGGKPARYVTLGEDEEENKAILQDYSKALLEEYDIDKITKQLKDFLATNPTEKQISDWLVSHVSALASIDRRAHPENYESEEEATEYQKQLTKGLEASEEAAKLDAQDDSQEAFNLVDEGQKETYVGEEIYNANTGRSQHISTSQVSQLKPDFDLGNVDVKVEHAKTYPTFRLIDSVDDEQSYNNLGNTPGQSANTTYFPQYASEVNSSPESAMHLDTLYGPNSPGGIPQQTNVQQQTGETEEGEEKVDVDESIFPTGPGTQVAQASDQEIGGGPQGEMAPDDFQSVQVNEPINNEVPDDYEGISDLDINFKVVYHKATFQLFFGAIDHPKIDPTLYRSVENNSSLPSFNSSLECQKIMLASKGEILVTRVISGDLQEYHELVQLYFCLKRNMATGPRIPMGRVPLSQLGQLSNIINNSSNVNYRPLTNQEKEYYQNIIDTKMLNGKSISQLQYDNYKRILNRGTIKNPQQNRSGRGSIGEKQFNFKNAKAPVLTAQQQDQRSKYLIDEIGLRKPTFLYKQEALSIRDHATRTIKIIKEPLLNFQGAEMLPEDANHFKVNFGKPSTLDGWAPGKKS